MAIVENGIIKVNGEPVGYEKESKYPIPSVIMETDDKPRIYVVK